MRVRKSLWRPVLRSDLANLTRGSQFEVGLLLIENKNGDAKLWLDRLLLDLSKGAVYRLVWKGDGVYLPKLPHFRQIDVLGWTDSNRN